jgi:hypothetical protein
VRRVRLPPEGPDRRVSGQGDRGRDRGIGKAYEITSNSWDYTSDGHSLAYHAGAELMDMEFVSSTHRLDLAPASASW